MSFVIACRCGQLKGHLSRTDEVNRCVCYCSDCQAFSRFLKQEAQVLDAWGGTDIVQTIAANVTLTQGAEHLSCMRLSERGMLRWYASCCNTPIGNTPATPKMPFVGLIHSCLSSDQVALDAAFGPVTMRVNAQSALGADKPRSEGGLRGTLRLLGMVLKARLDGRHKRSPFFVAGSKVSVVVPQVLSVSERHALRPAA